MRKREPEAELRIGWTLGLAKQKCVSCIGLGQVNARSGLRSCNCVRRQIFNICYKRFRTIAEADQQIGTTRYDPSTSRKGIGNWSMCSHEYAADFVLVAKRTLGEDSLGWSIFKWHYLYQQEWPACAAKLGINRGEFFHAVYRTIEILGHAYQSTLPYPLFPLDAYFSPCIKARKPVVCITDAKPKPKLTPKQIWKVAA